MQMRFVDGALQEMAKSSNMPPAAPFGMKTALSWQRTATIFYRLNTRRPQIAAECNDEKKWGRVLRCQVCLNVGECTMTKHLLKEFLGNGTEECEWCLSGVPQLFLHEATNTYWHFGCFMHISESSAYELNLEPNSDPNLIRITMAPTSVKE